MSTGDVRRPSVNKLSAKAVAADGPKPESDELDADEADAAAPAPAPAPKPKTSQPKVATKSSGSRPGGRPPAGRGPAKSGGGKGRKPVTPVKVSQGRNWGPIAMFAGAGLVAVLIIGFGAFQLIKQANQPPWQERAAGIEGISNYLESNPDWFVYDPAVGNHKSGVLTYPSSPPVGGVHNDYWQNCMGDVYPAEIPKEQATHSMEHGAVWIAYHPDLPKDQVDELAGKVRDRGFMLMSPYPGLDKPISVQAWGYQLKVDNAGDGRIDEFIDALRQNATREPQATCSGGITDPGKTPLDLVPPAQPGG